MTQRIFNMTITASLTVITLVSLSFLHRKPDNVYLSGVGGVKTAHREPARLEKGVEYYVSPDGNDNNEGSTVEKPLKTIRAAVQKMQAGDVCYLREGTYRESVVINKNDLTFKNFKNEHVTVTGLDEVTSWTSFTGKIFKAQFAPAEKDNDPSKPAHLNQKGNYFIQVFADNDLMPQAQYPNRSGDLLNWDQHGGDVKIFLDGKFQFLESQAKNWPANYWKGAVFHAIVERKFNAVQGIVGDHNGPLIQCAQYTAGWKKSNSNQFVKNLFTDEKGLPTGTGKGFVTNHINALDADGEWYWDKKTNILYFQPPAGKDISKMDIEARSRKFAFVFVRANNILVQGISIVADGIDIRESNNITISNCRITHPMPFYQHQDEYDGKAMINITGNENSISNCYIAHAWGSAVLVHSGIKNKIENNIIEDVDWMGTYNACIKAGGSQTQISHNTLHESGRFLIEGVGLKQSVITYNDMYDGMLIGQDGGGFYTYVTNGEKTEIAYNWVHDIIGVPWERSTLTEDHNLSVGIYLDGGCQNYNVHHNVIWNVKYGVVLNANTGKIAKGNNIDNNTIVSTDVSVLSKNLPHVYIDNSARNNLTNKKVAALVEKEGNVMESSELERNFPKRKEAKNSQRSMTNSSVRPDAITPTTDAGAYEPKAKKWKAGAEMSKIPIGKD